jgi:hypothetical protein
MIAVTHAILAVLAVATAVYVVFGVRYMLLQYKKRVRILKVSTDINTALAQTTITYQGSIPELREVQQAGSAFSGATIISGYLGVPGISANGQPIFHPRIVQENPPDVDVTPQ